MGGKPDEATEALERAFTAYSDAGRPIEAAGVAFRSRTCPSAARRPVGGGWLARAGRLLEGVPESGMHAGSICSPA